MDARKMMLVIGGEHDGASVEVEDYTFAVRLPLTPTAEEIEKGAPQRFALYYRTTIHIPDDDGSAHEIEFLRSGKLTTKQAIEARLLPQPRALS